MKDMKASTPQKYLPEDLRRLAVTIIIVLVFSGAIAWLEQKNHFIVRLFATTEAPVSSSTPVPTNTP